ncbi:MAG: ABC transporter permease [Candidatus Nanopelagicales bacterium]
MWFSLRDVRRHRARFALLGLLVALVGGLVMVLTGLGKGLADASVSAMLRMPGDAVVMQSDVRSFLARSTVTADQLAATSQVAGVARVDALGATTVSARTSDSSPANDITLFGVEPSGGLVPPGADLSQPGTAWADEHLLDKGVAVGDTLTLEPSKRQVRVAGFLDLGTYSHLPAVYVSLAEWQAVKFGPVDGVGPVPASASRLASAGVITYAEGADRAAVAAAIDAAVPRTEVLDRDAAIAATPGYKEETGTVDLMVGFLYVVAALVIGVFFWNAALARTGEIALLRAIGATRGRTVREHLSQVLLVAVAGTVLAAVGSLGLAALLPSGVPFLLPAGAVVSTALLFVVIALLAGVAPVRRITRVDPLLTLGRHS